MCCRDSFAVDTRSPNMFFRTPTRKRLGTNMCRVLACWCLAIMSAGCYTVRPIPLREMDEYSCREKVGDVTIAAEAFVGRHSADVFNHDVNEKGFLPVLVLVRNDGSVPVTINGGDICLRDSSDRTCHRVPAKVVASTCERNAGVEAALLFGMLSFMDANQSNDKMHADWQEKELATRLVVPPKSSSYGFAYFQAHNDRYERGASVVVPIVRGSDEYKEVIVRLPADSKR